MIPQQRLSSKIIASNYIYPDDQEILDTQDWELGGIALLDSSQGLEYQAWVSSQSASGDISLRALVTGITTQIYTKPGIIQHSFSFDQNMRWQLVYTLEDGTIEHIWYDSSVEDYVTTIYSNGEQSPRLCLDDKRLAQRSASDVLLFYIRNGTLYFRAQRDRYLIEYTLLAGFSPETLLLNCGMNSKLRVQLTTTEELIPPPPVPPPPPPVPPPTFTILNGSIPNGYTGSTYSIALTTKNGSAPITWNVDQGLLPPGLLLNGASGIIAGTPTTEGTYSFSVRATDSLAATALRNFTVQIVKTAAFGISGSVDRYAPASFLSTGPALYAKNYYGAIQILGGRGPYSVSLNSGTVPAGSEFRAGDVAGKLSGYLYLSDVKLIAVSKLYTVGSSYTFTMKIVDADGNTAITAPQELIIPVGISVASIPPGMTIIDEAYNITIAPASFLDFTFTVAGGVSPFTFSKDPLSWQLPGLTLAKLSPNTFRVSGSTDFVGPPDRYDYPYFLYIICTDSRGGLGGNGYFVIRVKVNFS